MIKEIIVYRRQGMSFRQIAEKLNTTVGKVHYQWIKSIKNNTGSQIKVGKKESIEKSLTPTIHTPFLETTLVSDNKLISNWEITPWQKEFVLSYFNGEVHSNLIILRIYDVTDIYFNGSNAHSFFEFQLPEDKRYWLIKGIEPERSYLTEIGFRLSNSKFFPILRSNFVQGTEKNDYSQVILKDSFLETKSCPDWVNQVSTYSYYESIYEVKKDHGN